MKVSKSFNFPSAENIKRAYIDAIFYKSCPDCGYCMSCDLSSDYLSYPYVDSEKSLYFYCDKCDNELEIPIKVKSFRVELEWDENDLIEAECKHANI